MAKYDWAKIEKEYIEGIADEKGQRNYPSQRELSERYGADPATIARRCRKDQWLTKREIFASKVSELRMQKSAEMISADGRDFDLQCFNLAENLRSEIDAMLADGMAKNPKSMSLLTASLKNLQSVGKAALGDKETGNQELSINITMGETE